MKKRVLYIEDEPFFAKTISAKLEESGFEADVATDGESGLSALNREHYDVVLLDLVLPKQDGFDVLKNIKSSEKNKNTPVIVLSNLSSDSDERKARELGARDFCVKLSSTPAKIISLVLRVTTASPSGSP